MCIVFKTLKLLLTLNFDMGFQRMWCKRLQGKALGLKIRTSEVSTIYIDLFLDKRGVFNLFVCFSLLGQVPNLQ